MWAMLDDRQQRKSWDPSTLAWVIPSVSYWLCTIHNQERARSVETVWMQAMLEDWQQHKPWDTSTLSWVVPSA
jgi:hypothetical protein